MNISRDHQFGMCINDENSQELQCYRAITQHSGKQHNISELSCSLKCVLTHRATIEEPSGTTPPPPKKNTNGSYKQPKI